MSRGPLPPLLLNVNKKKTEPIAALFLDESPTVVGLLRAAEGYRRDAHTHQDILGDDETLNLGYVCKLNRVVWVVELPPAPGTGEDRNIIGSRKDVDAFVRFVPRPGGGKDMEFILPNRRSAEGDDTDMVEYMNWYWEGLQEDTVILSTTNEWTALGQNINVRHAFSIAEAIQDRDAQRQYNRTQRFKPTDELTDEQKEAARDAVYKKPADTPEERAYQRERGEARLARRDDPSTMFDLTDEQREAVRKFAAKEYGDLPKDLEYDQEAMDRMRDDPEEMTMKIQTVKKMLFDMHDVMAHKNRDWVNQIVSSVYTHGPQSEDQNEYNEELSDRDRITAILYNGELKVQHQQAAPALAQGQLAEGDEDLYT